MTTIYEDLKQRRPFARAEEEALVTLLRTGDVARHAVERSLAAWNISLEQYNVLRILRGAGEEGLPTLEIASRMISRSPNITRLIDKLAAKKLARRKRNEKDRRMALVALTSRGAELMQDLDAMVRGVVDGLGCLSEEELHAMCRLMDRVRERLAVKTVKEEARARRRTRREEETPGAVA